MNINSTGAVSTLVPDTVAAARGPAAVTPAAGAEQSGDQKWGTTKEVENWASKEGPPQPQVKAETWAKTEETESWTGDRPIGAAPQGVDIKV